MGQIVVTEFVSVDGGMEAPSGAEEFEHGGWALEIGRGEGGDEFRLKEMLASEALLFGRVNCEGIAAAWPSRTGEFADKFNSMPQYLVSSTLEEAEWNNTTILDRDVVGEVSEVRQG